MIPRIVIGLIAASLLAVSATGRSQIVGDLAPAHKQFRGKVFRR